jgi:hypothetical protein
MLSKRRAAAVQAFESDRVDALLHHATGREEIELFASSGATLVSLAARVAGEPDPTNADWTPDQDVLAKVVRRIELRELLDLPRRECARENPEPEASACCCLSEALDKAADSATRAGIVKTATKAHKARWRWLRNRPASRPAPVPRPETPRPAPAPIPPPERATQTATGYLRPPCCSG